MLPTFTGRTVDACRQMGTAHGAGPVGTGAEDSMRLFVKEGDAGIGAQVQFL
jgi:hypothetical protein